MFFIGKWYRFGGDALSSDSSVGHFFDAY